MMKTVKKRLRRLFAPMIGGEMQIVIFRDGKIISDTGWIHVPPSPLILDKEENEDE
jgi:hypothetical protein